MWHSEFHLITFLSLVGLFLVGHCSALMGPADHEQATVETLAVRDQNLSSHGSAGMHKL